MEALGNLRGAIAAGNRAMSTLERAWMKEKLEGRAFYLRGRLIESWNEAFEIEKSMLDLLQRYGKILEPEALAAAFEEQTLVPALTGVDEELASIVDRRVESARSRAEIAVSFLQTAELPAG